MLSFFQFIEAVNMPRTMGNAKQAQMPTPAKMQAWSVTFSVPNIKTQVTAQSEGEVRRMIWEYLKDKFGGKVDAQSIEQAARSAQVVPMDDFNWKQMRPAPTPRQAPQQAAEDPRTGTYG